MCIGWYFPKHQDIEELARSQKTTCIAAAVLLDSTLLTQVVQKKYFCDKQAERVCVFVVFRRRYYVSRSGAALRQSLWRLLAWAVLPCGAGRGLPATLLSTRTEEHIVAFQACTAVSWLKLSVVFLVCPSVAERTNTRDFVYHYNKLPVLIFLLLNRHQLGRIFLSVGTACCK